MSVHRDRIRELVPEGMGFHVVDEIGQYDYEYWNGRLLVYEPPSPFASYTIGADPGQGKGEDRSVIQVIRNGDLNRPDEQVAEFASNFHGPVDLAPIVVALGRFYGGAEGEAMAAIECNSAGGGDTTQFDCRARFGYGNLFVWKVYDKTTNMYTSRLGWWTNKATRGKLVARGLHSLANGDLIVHSPFLLDEMEDFETDMFLAQAKAKFGRHDDRVMALLIAHWAAHDEEWLAGVDMAAERKRLTTADALRDREEVKTGQRPTWQASDMTYGEMLEAWEDAAVD